MSGANTKTTDSWRAYGEFLKAVNNFCKMVRLDGGELWVDDICLGAAADTDPFIRLPFHRDATARLRDVLERLEHSADHLMASADNAIATSLGELERLKREGEVEAGGLERLLARVRSLEALLGELRSSAEAAPWPQHPSVLLRWIGTLEQVLVPGEPAVLITVVTKYIA
jgi:hypothetical protein